MTQLATLEKSKRQSQKPPKHGEITNVRSNFGDLPTITTENNDAKYAMDVLFPTYTEKPVRPSSVQTASTSILSSRISGVSVPTLLENNAVLYPYPRGQVPPPRGWPATTTDVSFLQRPVVSPYLTRRQQRWLRQKPPSLIRADSDGNHTGLADTAVRNRPADVDATGAGDQTVVHVPVIKLPVADVQDRAEIRVICDTAHPACGQRGLFATRDLRPGEFVLPYLGYVHSSTASEKQELESRKMNTRRNGSEREKDAIRTPVNTADGGNGRSGENDREWDRNRNGNGNDAVRQEQDDYHCEQEIGSWDKSDYDLNLYRDEDIELAIDASQMGNEARFCNDYRGVPAFNDPSTSAATNGNGNGWDRRAKRAAKTSVTIINGLSRVENPARQSWNTHNDNNAVMAIPNAEFRDVWFEWNVEVDNEMGGDIHDRNGAEAVDEAMKNLRIGSKTSSKIPEKTHFAWEKYNVRTGSDQVGWKRKRRKDKMGMRGVAIFVLPAGKSGKRKHGIRAGQELLVSYGKGFWAHHAV